MRSTAVPATGTSRDGIRVVGEGTATIVVQNSLKAPTRVQWRARRPFQSTPQCVFRPDNRTWDKRKMPSSSGRRSRPPSHTPTRLRQECLSALSSVVSAPAVIPGHGTPRAIHHDPSPTIKRTDFQLPRGAPVKPQPAHREFSTESVSLWPERGVSVIWHEIASPTEARARETNRASLTTSTTAFVWGVTLSCRASTPHTRI